MKVSAHSRILFLLQVQPGALFDCFASQRIYGYALSREQPTSTAKAELSCTKGIMG